MSNVDELIPEFIAEATELIEKVYQDIPAMSSGEHLREVIDQIFRSIHTVKGGSGMFGFSKAETAAHNLESYLSEIKELKRTNGLSEEEISFILRETQKIETLIKSRDQAMVEVQSAPSASALGNNPITTAENEAPEVLTPTPSTTTVNGHTTSTVDYIRVPVQRINESMNIISEIFLIRNQMVHAVERNKSGHLDSRDFFQVWDQLDGALRRGIGELERSTLNMRMSSVQNLFSRMERTVQSSKSPGKKILFKTVGESTELDKKVLDTLAEPLVHLIRNAIDHGIEVSDERRSKGKAEAGTVTLQASIIGNEAVIEVSDDGQGINPKTILSVAQKKGLDTSHVKDDKTAIDLIFQPGFSTAQTVSEISGRGVGMDAVKTSVLSLGGKILIQSQIDRGSTFTIRLPVSVSVSPVVIINIKGLNYAIPNQDILEIRQTEVRNIHVNNGKQYVTFRDAFIECIDLRKIVKQESKSHEENMSEASLLFYKKNDQVIAAQVSSFEKNTEVIVKPTSGFIPHISWISGVSILPTGEPIFVLSLNRFQEKGFQEKAYVA